ncbi:cryptic autophosphorylating protein tyrosine kinase Etk [Megamonas hypermegale]|uniref:Cryptic autophosphorylating protein tyrosine kinase Etk n=1 Tax=Megamonas hypermegale TaxID=158847 RepID=A0A239U632_9FIRM|nr:Wzz/FepE/Etk N-terminal domain-containing protein [Megamonas hypermegale]SNV05591.1 cryptic autophosphorylating protein tyrosine kinase Etk [Megamonas hypermegale]
MDNINNNDSSIDLRKLFSIMGEQKKIIIPIIVICTVVAIVIAFVLPKTYQSNTLVRIKSSSNSSMSGMAAMAAGLGIDIGGSSSANPENYVELMKSREVLEPIMEQVDMPEEDKEKLTTEDFIKEYLEITNTRKTDLINIAAYGKTPEEAQMISQAVADNFLTLMTKLNKEDNSSVLKFLNDRMSIAKEEMETAENKLQAYQQEKGIYSPNDQTKALVDKLDDYDKKIAQLEAQEQANSAKLQDVTGQLEQQNSSLLEYNISDNDAIMNLRTAIVNKQVELVGLQQRYTEEHPDVIRAREELAELKKSLDREIQSAVNSKSATLTPVQGNLLMEKVQTETAEAVTSASLDALKAKQQEAEGNMSTLSADSVEYMRLLREKNITSEVYTNLVKAYENTRIQEAQESMDIQIIDAANLPREDMPAKPNKKLIAVIGFVFGIIISFGYTLYVYNKRYGL